MCVWFLRNQICGNSSVVRRSHQRIWIQIWSHENYSAILLSSMTAYLLNSSSETGVRHHSTTKSKDTDKPDQACFSWDLTNTRSATAHGWEDDRLNERRGIRAIVTHTDATDASRGLVLSRPPFLSAQPGRTTTRDYGWQVKRWRNHGHNRSIDIDILELQCYMFFLMRDHRLKFSSFKFCTRCFVFSRWCISDFQ